MKGFFRLRLTIEFLLGITQNNGAIRKNTIVDLPQLRERAKIAEGSKLENRLVIMFNL